MKIIEIEQQGAWLHFIVMEKIFQWPQDLKFKNHLCQSDVMTMYGHRILVMFVKLQNHQGLLLPLDLKYLCYVLW